MEQFTLLTYIQVPIMTTELVTTLLYKAQIPQRLGTYG